MGKIDELKKKVQVSSQKLKETGSQSTSTWKNICEVVKMVASWAYKLRSVLLAIPVVVASITMAIQNMARLPGMVGINLLPSGEYQFMVVKTVAVVGPLAVTALCLLLMFSSKKVLFPWLISVFSLALPWLIWVSNVFPA